MAGMRSCRIIDGRKIASAIRAETIELLNGGRKRDRPALLVISIGNDAAAESYSKQIERAASTTGIDFRRERLDAGMSEKDAAAFINRAAGDAVVSALMIHVPVPKGFDIDRLSGFIPPEKDVDCMNDASRGMLYSGRPMFSPATAEAVMEILKHEHIATSGKHVVVIGRSLTVGKPLASLLLVRGPGGDATVTICHSKSGDIARYSRQADILVAAAGTPHLVNGDMISEGATVIDVGINPIPASGSGQKYGITGDVDYESALRVAGAITPVPGGVGPVTSAVLMRNVAKAWRKGFS